MVVQIVDARNPLLFYCPDLEKYVKEVDPEKKISLVLVNKSDFLTARQRLEWLRYFEKHSIRVAFWSAVISHQLNDLAGIKESPTDDEDDDDDDDESQSTESSNQQDDDEDEDDEDEEEEDLEVEMNKFGLLGDEKSEEEDEESEETEKDEESEEEEEDSNTEEKQVEIQKEIKTEPEKPTRVSTSSKTVVSESKSDKVNFFEFLKFF